jgi:hypothetical protein
VEAEDSVPSFLSFLAICRLVFCSYPEKQRAAHAGQHGLHVMAVFNNPTAANGA